MSAGMSCAIEGEGGRCLNCEAYRAARATAHAAGYAEAVAKFEPVLREAIRALSNIPIVVEVDAEEERLRDAVVEASVVAHEALELVRDIAARQQRLADIGGYSDAISAEHNVAGPAYHEKHVALFAAVRALRAHREKVGR